MEGFEVMYTIVHPGSQEDRMVVLVMNCNSWLNLQSSPWPWGGLSNLTGGVKLPMHMYDM